MQQLTNSLRTQSAMIASVASLKSSFLFPVHSISSSKPLKANIETVQKALEDPPTIIKLDPLVESFTVSTSQVGLWNIVNRMKLLAFSFPLHYTARFQRSQGETAINVDAGICTIRNVWKATTSKEPSGSTVLSMECQTKVRSATSNQRISLTAD
jgi:hypothetical protein